VTASATPLLSRRALYFLATAAVIGIAAGVLAYQVTPVSGRAIVAGILAAGGTLGWLQLVDWPTLANWHGVGLTTLAIGIGAGVGWLTYTTQVHLCAAVLAGAPVAAASLLGLQKISP
jgi:hypothetical protein